MTEFKPGEKVLWRIAGGTEWREGTVVFYEDDTKNIPLRSSEGVLCWCLRFNVKKIENSSPRSEILDEAKKLITGDRNLSYGTPTQNFQNTADLWNVQLGHKLKEGESFTGTDVALLMTHLKMARLIASGTKRDNYADAIGYMACAWETVVSDDSSE